MDLKYGLGLKTGLIGFIAGSILFFNSSTVELFISGVLASSLLLAITGIVMQNLKSNKKKIASFVGLSIIFIGLAIPILSFSQISCEAYFPYSAENPISGECKEFVYGGCGPKPHPWYYQEGCAEQSTEQMNRKGDPRHSPKSVCRSGTEILSDIII